MSEWLFDDVRPFWAEDLPETHVLEEYTAEMRRRKEAKMTTAAKKSAAATTKKETTMTTPTKETTMTETKLTGKEKRAAELAALKEKYDAPAFDIVINFHNVLKAEYETEVKGEPVAPRGIYATDDEIEYLCWFAREMGWTNNAFCSKSQVPVLHGKVKDGAVGVRLFPKAGGPGTYYNYDDIEWENGEGPVYDPELARDQHRGYLDARKARRANVQMLPLPNGCLMPVDINDKRALKNYQAAVDSLKALVA